MSPSQFTAGSLCREFIIICLTYEHITTTSPA